MPAPDPIPAAGTSIPMLPARRVAETLAFYGDLGFEVRHDEVNDYGIARRGSIELHFVASPSHDPWTTAGMAYVRLDDVDSLYEEFLGVVPASSRPELQPAERLRDELRQKWDAGESIARMGALADQPWGIREFALMDCNNNLIRFGQNLP